MSVVLLISDSHQFVRRAKHGKGEVGRIRLFPQPGLNGGVGNVPTVPTQKYIHFVNGGECDVGGVAIGSGGQQARTENLLGQRLGTIGQVEQRDFGHEFDAQSGHRCLAAADFVDDDLRGEKLVLLALKISPVAGELLAGRLQKVACRTRRNVARYRAFDVDAHGMQCITAFTSWRKARCTCQRNRDVVLSKSHDGHYAGEFEPFKTLFGNVGFLTIPDSLRVGHGRSSGNGKGMETEQTRYFPCPLSLAPCPILQSFSFWLRKPG